MRVMLTSVALIGLLAGLPARSWAACCDCPEGICQNATCTVRFPPGRYNMGVCQRECAQLGSGRCDEDAGQANSSGRGSGEAGAVNLMGGIVDAFTPADVRQECPSFPTNVMDPSYGFKIAGYNLCVDRVQKENARRQRAAAEAAERARVRTLTPDQMEQLRQIEAEREGERAQAAERERAEQEEREAAKRKEDAEAAAKEQDERLKRLRERMRRQRERQGAGTDAGAEP